jgi:hypothetical protein
MVGTAVAGDGYVAGERRRAHHEHPLAAPAFQLDLATQDARQEAAAFAAEFLDMPCAFA